MAAVAVVASCVAPAALRRRSAAPERPVCVGNGESFKRSPSGLRGLASAERFLSTLLYFCCRQVLQVRGDCPYEPERILHFSIAVAPELIPYWRYDFAASRKSLCPRSICIRYVERQAYRPPGAVGFAPELREDIIQHHYGICDADAGVQKASIR